MADFPHTNDPLVAALQRLLRQKGGHVAVGDAAGVNDQSLYQIAYLKPHSKSKQLKSVGPSIRKRLDKAFPGWLDTGAPPGNEGSLPPHADLSVALETIGIALAAMPVELREAAATNLAGWARDGGKGPWVALVQTLLSAPPRKPYERPAA